MGGTGKRGNTDGVLFGAVETRMLLWLIALAALAWAFLGLAGEVMGGGAGKFDRTIMLLMRSGGNPAVPAGPPWFPEFVRDISALGSTGVLVGLILSAAGYLLLERKPWTALYLSLAIGTGMAAVEALKTMFGRERPDLIMPLAEVTCTSFPSGHSMVSALTWLTLAALLASVQTQRRVRVYLLALAMLVTAAVGVSRVYLGVHYPTDVLAGWAAGAFWALACRQAFLRLRPNRARYSEPKDS